MSASFFAVSYGGWSGPQLVAGIVSDDGFWAVSRFRSSGTLWPFVSISTVALVAPTGFFFLFVYVGRGQELKLVD